MKLHNPFTVRTDDPTLGIAMTVILFSIVLFVTYLAVINYGTIGIVALPITPALIRIIWAMFSGD